MKSVSILMSSLGVAAAGGWLAATLFAPPATSKEPRFPRLTMEQLNGAQKSLGEQVMKGLQRGIGRPLQSPGGSHHRFCDEFTIK